MLEMLYINIEKNFGYFYMYVIRLMYFYKYTFRTMCFLHLWQYGISLFRVDIFMYFGIL